MFAALLAGCAPQAPDPASPYRDGANEPDLPLDHAGYLRSVEGAAVELVEPGGDGAWREIRSGDRVVRLAAPPQRIASRTLGTDEILLEIAEPDRIVLLSPFVGDPEYSRSAEAARSLGRVGGFSTEEMIAAKPDLLFAAGFNSQETISQLETAGIQVLVLKDHESLAAIERNIRTVGFAIGRDPEAEVLVASMRERLARARERASPRVSGLRVVHYSSGVVLGRRTIFDDAIRHLGAVNLAARNDLVGWPRIGGEQIVLWDPDVIFTSRVQGDEAGLRAFDGTRAARAGNVVVIDGRDMNAISHHVTELVDRLAAALTGAAARLEGTGDSRRKASH